MSRPNPRFRREVNKLYRTGRIFRGRLMHVRVADSDLNQTLIAVRRKYGGAVRRNRARRRIRAICKEFLPNGHPGRLLLISLSDRSDGAGFVALKSDVRSALTDLGLLDS